GAGRYASARPAILVIQPDYVIFAKVFTALYLDDNQIDQAWVAQTVSMSGRDEGGFVDVDQAWRVRTIENLGHPLNNDPMFTAMMMHLQRQCCTGFDEDTFDFEARSFFENRIGTPRTVYRTM